MTAAVRNGFSRDLASLFLDDPRRQLAALDAMPGPPTPMAADKRRQAFRH